MKRAAALNLFMMTFSGCMSATPPEVTLRATNLMPRHESIDVEGLMAASPLADTKVRGLPLTPARGEGLRMGAREVGLFRSVVGRSQRDGSVQWIALDLDTGRVLAQSPDPDRLFYGASVVKPFVAGAVCERERGNPTAATLQQLADMIVVSDNSSWKRLQKTLGGGSRDRGQRAVQDFATRLGINRSKVFDGWHGTEHGNEISPRDMAAFMVATYRRRYVGSELVWTLMHAMRTGQKRGHAYLPLGLSVGGKTGSYRGASVDPATQRPARLDVRHHALAFRWKGRSSTIVVMSDGASDDEIAVLIGGLFAEILNR